MYLEDIQRRTAKAMEEEEETNKGGRTKKGEESGMNWVQEREQTKLFPLGITLCRWIWDRSGKSLIHGVVCNQKAKFYIFAFRPDTYIDPLTYLFPAFICPLTFRILASINIGLVTVTLDARNRKIKMLSRCRTKETFEICV